MENTTLNSVQAENTLINNQPLCQSDVETLKSIKKNSTGTAVCYILFIFLITIFVGVILAIIAIVKVSDLKDEETIRKIKTPAILLIVFSLLLVIGAIAVGFILSSRIKHILAANNQK